MRCELCHRVTFCIHINYNHEKLCADCYNGNLGLKYFQLKEFACRCCGEVKMDVEFLLRLDSARERAGIPFKINSGYRCAAHNKDVGSKSTSSHIKGLAADIRATTSRQRFIIEAALFAEGFKRMGEYPAFIHVDLDRTKPQMVKWRGK